MSRNTGIYGGAFDPPHAAHVMVAAYALCCLGIERLLVVPCADHPFDKDMTPFDIRFRMAKLGFEFLGDQVQVIDIESDLPKPSYTINTVQALKERYPGQAFSLLIGSDNAQNLDKWHRIEELRNMVRIVTVDRAGQGPLSFPPVSSTMIRRRLSNGLSVEGMVPDRVLAFIRKHGLYGTGNG